MRQTGQAITWITVIYTISVDQVNAFKKIFTKRCKEMTIFMKLKAFYPPLQAQEGSWERGRMLYPCSLSNVLLRLWQLFRKSFSNDFLAS
jgi:hypothetical protein